MLHRARAQAGGRWYNPGHKAGPSVGFCARTTPRLADTTSDKPGDSNMSLYRRGAVWWIAIEIGGQRVQESTRTRVKSEAEAYEQHRRAELWRQVQLGEHPAYRWEDAVLRWLSETAAKRDHHGDRQRLRFLHANLEGKQLTQINNDLLNRILYEAPHLQTPAARNRYRATVRAILRRAERDWQWIDRAPPIRLEREPAGRTVLHSTEDMRRLLAELPEHARVPVEFALQTGLRLSNWLYLRWEQVNLDQRQLTIQPSESKSGEPITIPLNTRAVALLRAEVGKHNIYVWTHGGQPYRWLDNRTWRAACDRAGLPGFRIHDLRHVWASWLAQAGVPDHILQRLGGWRTVTMLRRYSHLNIESLRASAEQVPTISLQSAQVLDLRARQSI